MEDYWAREDSCWPLTLDTDHRWWELLMKEDYVVIDGCWLEDVERMMLGFED